MNCLLLALPFEYESTSSSVFSFPVGTNNLKKLTPARLYVANSYSSPPYPSPNNLPLPLFLRVILCFPIFLLSRGFHWKQFLVMLLANFLCVRPVQSQRLFLTSWFTDICLVFFISSALVNSLYTGFSSPASWLGTRITAMGHSHKRSTFLSSSHARVLIRRVPVRCWLHALLDCPAKQCSTLC